METKIESCFITSNVDNETMSVVEALTNAEKDTIFVLKGVKISKGDKEYTLKRVAEKTEFGVSVSYNFILEPAVTSDSGNSSDKTSESSSDKESYAKSDATSIASSDDEEEHFASKLIHTFKLDYPSSEYEDSKRRLIKALQDIRYIYESGVAFKNKNSLFSSILNDMTYLEKLAKSEDKYVLKAKSKAGENVEESLSNVRAAHMGLFSYFKAKFLEKAMVLVSSLPMSDDSDLDSHKLKAKLQEAIYIANGLKKSIADLYLGQAFLQAVFSLQKVYKELSSNEKHDKNFKINEDSFEEESIHLSGSEKDNREGSEEEFFHSETDRCHRDTVRRLHRMLNETNERLTELEMSVKDIPSLLSPISTHSSQSEYKSMMAQTFDTHLRFLEDGFNNFYDKLKEVQYKLDNCENKMANYKAFWKNQNGVSSVEDAPVSELENPVFKLIMEKKMQQHDPHFLFVDNKLGDLTSHFSEVEEGHKQPPREIFCGDIKETRSVYEKSIGELEAEIKSLQSNLVEYDELISESEKLENEIEVQNKMIAPFRPLLEFYNFEQVLISNSNQQYERIVADYLEERPEVYRRHGKKQRTKHIQSIITKNHELSEKNKELKQKYEDQTSHIRELENKCTERKAPHPKSNGSKDRISTKTAMSNKVKSSPVWGLTIPVERSLIAMPRHKNEFCKKLLYPTSKVKSSKTLRKKFANVTDLSKELSGSTTPNEEEEPRTSLPLNSTVVLSKSGQSTPQPKSSRASSPDPCKKTVFIPKKKKTLKKRIVRRITRNKQVYRTI